MKIFVSEIPASNSTHFKQFGTEKKDFLSLLLFEKVLNANSLSSIRNL